MLKSRLLTACLAPIIALTAWSSHASGGSVASAHSPPLPEKAASKAFDPGPRPKVGRNFPEVLERVAFRAAKAGNHKAAVIFYRRILEHEPHRRSARLGLADSLTRTGRHAEAIGLYREVLAAGPNDPSVRSRLGVALLAAGRPDDALPHLQAALEARRTVTTLNRIGVAYLLGGKTGRAQQYFTEALKIRPRDRVVRNNAAIALYKSGRREEAERLLSEDVRDQNPPDELRKNLMLMKMVSMPGAPPTPGFALLSADEGGSPRVISSIGRPVGQQALARAGDKPVAARASRDEAEPATKSLGRRPGTEPPHATDGSSTTTLTRQTGPAPANDPYRRLVVAGIASHLGKLAAKGAPAAANASDDGAIRVAAAPGPSARAAPGATNGAFVVQVGAFRDKVKAKVARRRLLSVMAPLFDATGIGVDPDDRGGRGLIYKLRTRKATDRAAAQALCARLRARSVSCFIAKASPG